MNHVIIVKTNQTVRYRARSLYKDGSTRLYYILLKLEKGVSERYFTFRMYV